MPITLNSNLLEAILWPLKGLIIKVDFKNK